MPQSTQDPWAQWLLHKRHGGDPKEYAKIQSSLHRVRDRILRNADIGPADVVLDVGTGTGLLAFGALGKVGQSGQVIFSDVSTDLLAFCRQLADKEAVLDRCRFLQASADDLSKLGDNSTSVVVARSVLVYVPKRSYAFQEFHRVLRSGGRLSIFEPVGHLGIVEGRQVFEEYDVAPVADLARKVREAYERLQVSGVPVAEVDGFELTSHAENAGFSRVHSELLVDLFPVRPIGWETYIRVSQNPRVPSIEESMQASLTPAEIESITAHLRPLVESGQGMRRDGRIYLWAIKR